MEVEYCCYVTRFPNTLYPKAHEGISLTKILRRGHACDSRGDGLLAISERLRAAPLSINEAGARCCDPIKTLDPNLMQQKPPVLVTLLSSLNDEGEEAAATRSVAPAPHNRLDAVMADICVCARSSSRNAASSQRRGLQREVTVFEDMVWSVVCDSKFALLHQKTYDQYNKLHQNSTPRHYSIDEKL